MPAPDRSRALDHIVVVLFENRSLDNVGFAEPGLG
jgi:phospholipase C